jgi:tetratricopeptide (TPR) repeat protein
MSTLSKTESQHGSSAVAWLYNPWLDLVVGCGAWSAPLLLLSYFSSDSNARAWSVAFYALALFFNYPHYMATIYRAYHRAEDFQKYRIFTLHMTAVILLTVFISHFWLRMLPWIFTLYLTWSPWHYTGQNYGVFMMFARRAGAKPGQTERRALYGAFIASYLVLFLSFHSGASADPLFISLGIPSLAAHCGEMVFTAAFLALTTYGIWPLLRETGWRKLLPSLTLFSSQILWFLLPVALTLIRGLEIPQNRYSTGVLAIMHSAQYLWITSYYARREAKEAGSAKWRSLGYFALLIVGGIALFVPGPWLASRIFHHDFTTSFLIFTALVNLHHFILDGAIWKLRDGRVASLLLNSKDRVTNAASATRSWLSSIWAWIFGGTSSARFLRISAAVLLLAWGIVDQTRYYFSLHFEDLNDLQRAVMLDSFDSSTQMRLARRELEAGHSQQAEAAWRQAIQSNPADPASRQALLRFLLEQHRFDEAYDLAKASLVYTPRDANLWLDYGLLARQRGDSRQAIESWNRAIAIDFGQVLAHLYLASELDHAGKPQEAVGHYRVFLGTTAQQPPSQRPPAEEIIAIIIRMADCQTKSSQTTDAVQSYKLAAKLAAQTGQTKLQSVAEVNEAALESTMGNFNQALQLYQNALRLDNSIGDQTSSAEDWFTYGRFLQSAGFPERLAYACFVKSESLQSHLSDPSQREYVTELRAQAAKHIGKLASDIRRDPEPTLSEALELRR